MFPYYLSGNIRINIALKLDSLKLLKSQFPNCFLGQDHFASALETTLETLATSKITE